MSTGNYTAKLVNSDGTLYNRVKETGVSLHQYKMKVINANYSSVNQYGYNANLKAEMLGAKPRQRNTDSTSSTGSNKEN